MRVDLRSGLLEATRFVPSPNCDARPPGTPVDVLVIHAISLPPGQFTGDDIERLFCNTLDFTTHPFYREINGLTVSAHVLIRRSGEVIQFVPFHLRAWHAGVSMCHGRTRVNDFSIGIELEGADDVPFEDAQYRRLAEVTAAIVAAYPAVVPDNIVGHCDIAAGRKSDPGPCFDWGRYRASLDASRIA